MTVKYVDESKPKGAPGRVFLTHPSNPGSYGLVFKRRDDGSVVINYGSVSFDEPLASAGKIHITVTELNEFISYLQRLVD